MMVTMTELACGVVEGLTKGAHYLELLNHFGTAFAQLFRQRPHAALVGFGKAQSIAVATG